MQAKLLLVGGRATKKEISLSLPTVLGRDQDAGIAVLHHSISRQHCELFERSGQLVVRDKGSANGIFVGDQRVEEAVLQPGDTFTVGPLTFQAVYEPAGQPNGSPTAPPPAASLDVEEDWAIESVEDESAFDVDLATDATKTASTDEVDFDLSDDFDGLALPLDQADRVDEEPEMEVAAVESPDDAFPLPQDDDLEFTMASESELTEDEASIDEAEYELGALPELPPAGDPESTAEAAPIAEEDIRDFSSTADVFDEPSQELFFVEDELPGGSPPLTHQFLARIAEDEDSIPDFNEDESATDLRRRSYDEQVEAPPSGDRAHSVGARRFWRTICHRRRGRHGYSRIVGSLSARAVGGFNLT